MQWFKMYGIEMMADPKFLRLSASERSCWLTLLCLASMDNGVVRNVDENYLMSLSGISPSSHDWANTHGVLLKFEALSMITVGFDEMKRSTVIIKNWEKRQGRAKSGYERLKKHRLKAKFQNDNVIMITNDNGQNRIEENRIEYAFSKENDSPILEVRLDSEGKEKQPKKKRESDPAWPLFQRTTAMLSKCAGFPVLTAEKDFVRLKEAMKSLKEKDVIGLVESEIESGWADKVGYSLAAMLTNSRINKYKADWNV